MTKNQAVIGQIVYLYSHLMAIIVVTIVYLDLANYLSKVIPAIVPKYIYYMFGVMIMPIIIYRFGVFVRYAKTHYFIWILVFFFLNMAHYVVLSAAGNSDAASMASSRSQFLLLSIIIGFVLIQLKPSFTAWIFIIVALLLSCLQLFDFFIPGVLLPLGTEGVVVGRAGSTLINANRPAESLILLSILGMAVLRPNQRLILLAIVLGAIFVSFSRGGMLVWLFVVLYGFWRKFLPRKRLIITIIAGIVLIYLSWAVLLPFILSNVDFAGRSDIMGRINFFRADGVGDAGGSGRIELAIEGWRVFLNNPIVGNGVGFTHLWNFSDQSTHNEHMLFLAEYGIFGYFLFLLLFVLVYKGGAYFRELRMPDLGSAIGLTVLGFAMFTHNMFDNLYWLVSFALVCSRRLYPMFRIENESVREYPFRWRKL